MGQFIVEKYTSIKLDGVIRKGKDLSSFCTKELTKENIPQWKKDIYLFISDWLSNDDFIIASTSGSTGIPKKIKLLKSHMLASANKTVAYFNLTVNKSALLCLSAHYIAGKMMVVRAFVGGFDLLLVEPSGTPLKSISHTIDFVAMVPLQVAKSLSEIKEGKKVKSVIIGGGVISAELKEYLLLAKTDCYETYGMTETVSHVAIRKVGECVFKAMSQVLFGKDDRGCLMIDALDILQEPIITNDMVELISETSFNWLGRYDNVINSGGVKIIPEMVELKLSEYIDIPFFITAIPDSVLGDKVVLVIERGVDIEIVRQQLFAVTDILRYEKPKDVIAVIVFPFTESNKIRRVALKKLVAAVIESS